MKNSQARFLQITVSKDSIEIASDSIALSLPIDLQGGVVIEYDQFIELLEDVTEGEIEIREEKEED